MKKLLLCTLLCAVAACSGCVTKSRAQAELRKAYLAGEKQGIATQLGNISVWVVGNVRKPLITWNADLTLARALVDADYLGAKDPESFIVVRDGERPITITLSEIMGGIDLPLRPGDRIEIRP